MNAEVRLTVSIGVVVKRLSQFTQLLDLARLEPAAPGKRLRRMREIVAVGANDSPETVLSFQITVHEHACADVGRRLDVRAQVRMFGNRAGKVMIEVFNLDSALKQSKQRGPIGIQRNVQYRHRTVPPDRNATEQRHVALDTRYQQGLQWLREAQLVQSANSIGVAIEHIVMLHTLSPDLVSGIVSRTIVRRRSWLLTHVNH